MNWKVKSFIQNMLAMLPSSLSYDAYFLTQSKFGRLRKIDPLIRLGICAEILERIASQGKDHVGRSFFEVGTGRRIVIPLGLWLCGAGNIITIDKNPYLSEKLVFKDIEFMRNYPEKVRLLLGAYSNNQFFEQRFEQLYKVENLDQLFNLTGIQYLSPADASCTGLADNSIDYHISYVVLEHIAKKVIGGILAEFKRIVREDGLFIHCVDFSDHFSHSDKSITSINFLQFSQAQWDKYANNRYMYQNRMRVDDLSDLLKSAGLDIIKIDARINNRSLELLKNGKIALDQMFADKTPEANATSSAWIIARIKH